MKQFNDAKAAYIAGLLDGEGAVWIQDYYEKRRNNKHRQYGRLKIVNTNRACLEFIVDTVGSGGISVCAKINEQHKKIVWEYVLQRKTELLLLLERIYEFLIIKKENALKVINHLKQSLG